VFDHCPIISLHLFWVYNVHVRENMWFLVFWAWLTSLKRMSSSAIHLLANVSLLFQTQVSFQNILTDTSKNVLSPIWTSLT
jgi:hypothetical protein